MTPQEQAEAARAAAEESARAEQQRRQMEAELQRHGQAGPVIALGAGQ